MDHVSLAYGLLNSFAPVPDTPQWNKIALAADAREQRDHAKVAEILSQIGDPGTASEEFAIEFLCLSMNIHRGNMDVAKTHANRLEQNSLFRIPVLKATADTVLGQYLHLSGKYDEAMDRLLEAWTIFRAQSWDDQAAICIAEIGNIQFIRGDSFGALDLYLSALAVFESSGSPVESVLLLNIAMLAARMGDNDLALSRIDQLLAINPYCKNGSERANILLTQAALLKSNHDYKKSRDCYNEVLSIISNDEHPTMYLRAKVALADLSLREDDVISAAHHIEELNEFDRSTVVVSRLCEYLITKGEVYSKMGRHHEALSVYGQALDKARSVFNDEDYRNLLSVVIENVVDKEHRFKLLEEYWEVSRKAGANAKDGVRAILDMRTRYTTEKYRMAVERQSELANAVVDAQQQLMEEIGRDLHDSIGQDITVLLLLMNQLQNRLLPAADNADAVIETMQVVTQRIAADSRQIANRLVSKRVTSDNLLESMMVIKSELSVAAPSLKIEIHHAGSIVAMPDSVALSLYRIVQSVLNNVVRHAFAQKCSVNLVAHEDHYHLDIEDNGVGFEPLLVREGIGLREAKARAELLGGRVRIDSKPGSGTLIEVVVPIRK